jgi:hypothetical protein
LPSSGFSSTMALSTENPLRMAQMITGNKSRRWRIVVSDEETGEEVTAATGVETLILLVAPDTSEGQEYRRILMGDLETSIQLLFDIVRDVTRRMGRGTIVDLSKALDDDLLLEVTEELPPH